MPLEIWLKLNSLYTSYDAKKNLARVNDNAELTYNWQIAADDREEVIGSADVWQMSGR